MVEFMMSAHWYIFGAVGWFVAGYLFGAASKQKDIAYLQSGIFDRLQTVESSRDRIKELAIVVYAIDAKFKKANDDAK